MGILQDEFDRILDDKLSKPNLIKDLLRRAVARRGIEITDEQLAKAAAKIVEAPEGTDEFSFEFDDGKPDQNIELSVDLAAGLREFEAEFESTLEGAIPRAIDETWPSVLSALYRDLPKTLRHRRTSQRRFEQRLHATWKDGLNRLEMLLIIAQESGETFLADVNSAIADDDESITPEDRILPDALVRIHARSCRVASEVLCLLKGGFADGAIARWRSLHENAIVALFIAQHGADTAKRYLRHSAVECHKHSVSYQQHCQSLGQPPLSAQEVAELKTEFDAAIAEYGPEFKYEYGWAASAIGTKKPTFADIEEHLDLDRWRPYFKLACHSVHAGPHGLYFCLGNTNDTEPILLAGASDAGIFDPGHCTAISLLMVSAAAYTSKPNMDALVTLKVMVQLCDDIGESLIDAHDQFTAESEPNE